MQNQGTFGLFNMFSGGALSECQFLALGDYATYFCIDYGA